MVEHFIRFSSKREIASCFLFVSTLFCPTENIKFYYIKYKSTEYTRSYKLHMHLAFIVKFNIDSGCKCISPGFRCTLRWTQQYHIGRSPAKTNVVEQTFIANIVNWICRQYTWWASDTRNRRGTSIITQPHGNSRIKAPFYLSISSIQNNKNKYYLKQKKIINKPQQRKKKPQKPQIERIFVDWSNGENEKERRGEEKD